MGPLNTSSTIENFRLEPLNEIADERGSVLHMMREDSPLFIRFGEIYFSEVKPGAVKAWKRHLKMTQNFAVPVGRIRLVLFDDRAGSPSCGRVQEVEIGRPDAYLLAQIPPLVWYGFQAMGRDHALIANCADLAHTPGESEAVPVDAEFIPFKWTSAQHEPGGE